MIVWLPGAYSARDSFNFFRSSRDWGAEVIIEYDANGDLVKITEEIKSRIQRRTKEPVNIIGHSLGGVIAVALSNIGLPTNKIVTMSSPFGGLGPWWPPKTLGAEIRTLNRLTKTISVEHQCYISTGGNNPWLLIQNDGIISVTSQKAIEKANYIEVPSNHFEILMNRDVVTSVRKFLEI
jgi:alpha-beta hydrolase superfamily lysophospholipase